MISMFGEPMAKVIELGGDGMAADWGPAGVTSWELAESGGRTRLTFVQSGFDERRPPYPQWIGWLSGVAELRRFVEQDDWWPIWLTDASAA